MKGWMLLLLLWGGTVFAFSAVDIHQQSASDLTISFKLPDFKLDYNDKYSKIFCPDLTGHPQTGFPDLPFQEYKIAVPTDGNIQIKVASTQIEKQPLKLPVEPVPSIERGKKSDNYLYTVNDEAYRTIKTLPYTVSSIQQYRSMSYVSLRIYPFSYDQASKELTIERSITLQVHINGDVNQRIMPTDNLHDSFLKEMLNGSSAQYWGTREIPDIKYTDFSVSDRWYSFETAQDGIYAITYNQLHTLLNANIVDVNPDSIRIFTTGGQIMSPRVNDGGLPFREVPLLIDAGGDINFDQGDRILFYGLDRDDYSQNQPIIQDVDPNWFYAPIYFNPYSQPVKYWLTYTGDYNTAPARITLSSTSGTPAQIRTSQPETVKLESDRLKRGNPMGFHMFQSILAGSSTATYNYSFNAENVNITIPQKIITTLQQQTISGGSGGTHYMGLTVNQVIVVSSFSWSADNYATVTRTGNFCQNGNNPIQLTIYRTHSDNIYLDYFKIEYEKYLIKTAQQAYRVNVHSTDYNQLIRYEFTSTGSTSTRVFKISNYYTVSLAANETITNGFAFQAAGDANTRFYVTQDGDYLNVNNLRAENPINLTTQLQPIDNLIIAPTVFKPQAEQLKSYYDDQLNVSSKVVDVQDIYNQFNSGMPDPTAIRQYIRYCFYHYPAPALTSVTLLGLGTNDWRNQSGEAASKNQMIVYQKIGTYASEITSDDYFAMMSTGNSSYPELAIGRYPARSTTEMDFLLNRVIQYGSVPNPGWWRNTLLFVADDDVNGDVTGEWIHSQYMEQGSQVVNRSVLVDKIFAIDYDFDEFGNKPEARDDMIAKINEGTLVWYYNGHGSYDKLGSEDYFNGFSDMSRLQNTEHLPLFLAASCDVGEFDSYTFDCLGEKLAIQANGGVIATVASTRLCYAPENSALMNYVFDKAINQRKPIGEGIRLAKFSSGSVDNDATYVLLGDPLLQVYPPQKNSDIQINTTNNQLQARQTAQITGSYQVPELNGKAEMRTYDSDFRYHMPDNSSYTKNNNPIFKGNVSLTQGDYTAGFVVPDDIIGGTTARIITYFYDTQSGKDYINYYSPLTLSGHNYIADNPDSPNVHLFLETTAFRPGDQVSTNPVLYAQIEDSTGINILGAAGHKILLILDNGSQPVDVTNNFIYNTNSYTSGSLTYQFPEITEGSHYLQLIVFDNFNRPTVAETHFIAKKSGALTILKMLPYPNPMKRDGIFSLVLNDTGQITLTIYTITGKKIKTILQDGQRGYNQISWDGTDDDGDYLANNTYLYKVKVKNGSKNAEKTGQFIIYH
jgi:hypothetical protein